MGGHRWRQDTRGLGVREIGIIQELTATPELSKTYMGKVQRITDFGAFVEIMAGTDGLLHVSEIANHRVKDVRDELKEGQQILVKVIAIDPTGKIRLSRKVLLQEEAAGQGAGSGAEPARTHRYRQGFPLHTRPTRGRPGRPRSRHHHQRRPSAQLQRRRVPDRQASGREGTHGG